MGDRDLPASEPRYTECRPSHTGQVILDAEAGRLAPVPVGLINGTNLPGRNPAAPGTRPRHHRPAPPHRPPRHPRPRHPRPRRPALPVTGCTITGDLDALNAGHPVTLRQTGQITRTSRPVPETIPDPRPLPPGITPTPSGTPPILYAWTSSGPDEEWVALAHLIIETLPPGTSPGDIGTELASHARTAARATPDQPRPTPPPGHPAHRRPDRCGHGPPAHPHRHHPAPRHQPRHRPRPARRTRRHHHRATRRLPRTPRHPPAHLDPPAPQRRHHHQPQHAPPRHPPRPRKR
jgi:hypothetical protein